MTPRRFLLGAATVLTALLLQGVVIERLPLPGAAPDLLLLVVIAFALVEGPVSGVVTGFVAGLLADAQADHALGRLALAYLLVGYAVGLVDDERPRSVLAPYVAAALGTAGAIVVFGVEGLLLGDARVNVGAVLRAASTAAPYAVLLTPLVFPAVRGLVRRIDAEPVRW